MASRDIQAAIKEFSGLSAEQTKRKILAQQNGDEETEEPENHGNTGLPFGLCKKHGIALPDNATPRDAWEALKGIGIYPPWTDKGGGSSGGLHKDGKPKGTLKEGNASKKVSVDDLHPATIANVAPGVPMSFEQANQGRVNPHFKTGEKYGENCQTCVVCYEARLRGYDVEALPYGAVPQMRELARNTSLAWIDPITNEPPKYIFNQNANTPKRLKAFLETTIEKGARYTMQFHWKGKGAGAHIVSVDRQADGTLRLYDPQSGRVYTGGMVNRLLNEIKFSTSHYGMKFSLPPKILRVDNMKFNSYYVDKIMKRSEK